MKRLLYLFLIITLLTNCSINKKSIHVKSEYLYERDVYLIHLDVDRGRCSRLVLKDAINNVVLKEAFHTDVIYLDKNSVKGKKIVIFFDNKIILENLTLPSSNYKLINSLLTNKSDILDVVEREKDNFKSQPFFKEFKEVYLKDKVVLWKAISLFDFFPLEKSFDLTVTALKTYPEDSKLKAYFIDKTLDFIALPQFEKEIAEIIHKMDENEKKMLIDELLKRPTDRTFYIILPYLEQDIALAQKIKIFIEKNYDVEFSKTAVNYMKEHLNDMDERPFLKNIFYVYMSAHEEKTDKVELLKKLLCHKSKELRKIAIEEFNKIEKNDKIAQVLRENFSCIDYSQRFNVFIHIEPYFERDLSFYKEMLFFLHNKKDLWAQKVLSFGESVYKEEWAVKLLLEMAEEKVLASDLASFFEKSPKGIKKRGLKKLFEKHLDNRDVLNLLAKYDKEKYVKRLYEILNDEKNSLFDYALESLIKYDDKAISFYKNLYFQVKSGKNKIEILKLLITLGEDRFVLERLKKDTIEGKEELYEKIMSNASDDIVNTLWQKRFDVDERMLIALLRGIENRRSSKFCDDIEEIMMKGKSREVKFQAIWALAYACTDMYGKIVFKNKDKMDKDVFMEALQGFNDIVEISHATVKESFMLLKNIYRETTDEEIKKKILDVIELRNIKGEKEALQSNIN